MNPSPSEIPPNRHILVVDDNVAIHEDFRKILAPYVTALDQSISQLESNLFGEPSEDDDVRNPPSVFELDSAYQGEEGVDRVRTSLVAGSPYAVAFVDVRMPPGIDGIETIERLWATDSTLQVVVCTAFSDFSWDEMTRRLGRSDNLLILKKPFDLVEVLQLAHALTEKWRLHRAARLRLDQLEALVDARTAELTAENDRRRQTEKELKRARLAAEAASRAKSVFLANMSHEIRTPMNGVVGMCQLLLHSDLTAAQRDLAETLASSSEALLSLLNDILDVSKIEAGRLELENTSFSLEDLVHSTIRLFGAKAREKGLDLRVDLNSSACGTFMGDPARLRQVLMNLISNAIKFTHQGEVALQVRRVGDEGSVERLEFLFRDTGIGIDSADLTRLFSPFTQADSSISRRFGGTGLGLTICKRLVERMGGSIDVSSAVGSGSVFTVQIPFPRSQPPTENGEVTLVSPEAAHGRAADFVTHEAPCRRDTQAALTSSQFPLMRALVAEDNPVNQKVATLYLERLGFQVDVSRDGHEAVRAATTDSYDVVLMDCQMPGLSGLDATRKVREHDAGTGRHLPIIAMTAGAVMGDRENCLAAGMDDYVAKPVRLSDLEAVLLRHLPRFRSSAR